MAFNCSLPQIQEALLTLTGRFGKFSWARKLTQNNIVGAFQKNTIPWDGKGQGFTLNYTQYERVNFDGDLGLTPIDGSQCTYPVVEQRLGGKTLKQANLERAVRHTQAICLLNIYHSHEPEETIKNYADNLFEIEQGFWNRYCLVKYTDLAGNKIVADSAVSYGAMSKSAVAFPASAPVTSWTAGIAFNIHNELTRTYGYDKALYFDDTGMPIYEAWCSAEMLQNMIRNDAEIRQDSRFAYQGFGGRAPLLQTIPIEVSKKLGRTGLRVYGGFAYNIIPHPRRWDLVGGTWVERLPFGTPQAVSVGVATTSLSIPYQQAEYEDVIIYTPHAYKLIIPSFPTVIGNTNYGLKATTGQYQWLNEKFFQIPQYDSNGNPTGQFCQNLDNEWGFWRMNFIAGMLPQNTELAYVVRVRRCPVKIDALSCVNSY